MEPKNPKDSFTIITDLVLPSETNPIGNMFGGELLASVNHVAFNKMIPLGSVVTVEAKVSRAFKSSMEVFMDVWIEDRESGIRSKANEGIYTFVAVNEMGNPMPVPPIVPETQIEKQRFDAALRRKQLSLLLAGKINPQDATELKALFE